MQHGCSCCGEKGMYCCVGKGILGITGGEIHSTLGHGWVCCGERGIKNCCDETGAFGGQGELRLLGHSCFCCGEKGMMDNCCGETGITFSVYGRLQLLTSCCSINCCCCIRHWELTACK